MNDLTRETGFAARTIRLYAKHRLVPKTVYRGKKTRYSEAHLVCLRAIKKLRAQGKTVPQMKRAMSRMTPEAMKAWTAPPAAVAAEAVPPASASPRTENVVAAPRGESWARVALVPGLELHVRQGAGAIVARLAAEIAARYGITRGVEETTEVEAG